MIDLDSRAVNVERNQEGAVKGYHPHHKGNNCYNILMAFCDELKAYITGFMRSGNTYTTSFFRMDSGYESEEIAEVIEEAGYQYVVKAKEYSKPA